MSKVLSKASDIKSAGISVNRFCKHCAKYIKGVDEAEVSELYAKHLEECDRNPINICLWCKEFMPVCSDPDASATTSSRTEQLE